MYRSIPSFHSHRPTFLDGSTLCASVRVGGGCGAQGDREKNVFKLVFIISDGWIKQTEEMRRCVHTIKEAEVNVVVNIVKQNSDDVQKNLDV